MNIHVKKRHIKGIALLTVVLSALLYAAAVFIPSTQPTVILGKYVLQDPDILGKGTIAYRPWFENGAWQGDIIEYEITADGIRQTDATVEGVPAAGTSGMCGREASGCWTARATFIDKGADSTTGTYWKSREIITNNNGQVDFFWSNLSPIQRAALDPDTDPAAGDYDSPLLNYIRGERINERVNDGGYMRTRYSVFGDITNTPVYIGPPRELLTKIDGYSAFASDNDSRDGRIAAGANDGMLHVFDEDDGSEVFAYIPSMVIGKLGLLAARYESYQHTYYVDGEPQAHSAQIDGDWYTILTGGGGAGFAGMYALDMTREDFDSNKILFEKDAADGFGHIYGKPQIVPIGTDNAAPDWYIVTGNGYSTDTSHPTALMMISLDHPETDVYQITSTGGTGNMGTGGLSAPAMVSTDDDDMPELAFAGDLKGDLWMIEINQLSPENSIATKVYDGSIDQPITSAPSIGEHPTENGFMVYFGTGSILSMNDALNDGAVPNGSFTKKQAVYGIWVNTSNMTTLKSSLPIVSGNLQSQTVVATIKADTEQPVRYVPTENPVYYRCPYSNPSCTLKKGWKVELPHCGERLVGAPFLRAGRLQFVTTNPTGLNCGERTLEGDSWVMSLDYLTGGDGDTIVYNLNGDDKLSPKYTVEVDSNGDGTVDSTITVPGDTVDVDIDGDGTVDLEDKPPVGLNLGPGNIAQPAFARLDKGIDKMYINGLILAIPVPNPGPLLGGHLDVATDSPSDGVIATNEVSKHSEGYMVHTGENDGLGGAVDGHIHDYDGMHGVNYVDMFQLEPRRGKANLVATLVRLADGETCDASTPNEKGIAVDGSCIEQIEGELNRAYDTLHTDGDGNMHDNNGPAGADGLATPVLQSEVNSLGVDPDFEDAVPDKKFIVVLANADLSIAGMLQIGCKVWPVVEYQNMITSRLQALQVSGATDLGELVDEDGDSLIFTLSDIMASDPTTCPGGDNAPDEEEYTEEFAITKGLSSTPTLRVAFGERSILDGDIHPTRAQCVLGLHDYRDTVCYTDQEVLTAADAILSQPEKISYQRYSSCSGLLPPTPPDDYLRYPSDNLHITSVEGKGFRWRNGALTVQLLDAGINPSADLQDADDLVAGAGTFAKAFTSDGDEFTNEKGTFADGNSGMLYETTMFWHYSDLVDKSRNEDPEGNTTPPEGGCYSGPGYSGKTVIDIGGTNPAETRKLLQPLQNACNKPVAEPVDGEEPELCELGQYVTILERIANAETEDDLNQALLDLAALLERASEALKEAHDLWEYIPEDQKPSLGDLGLPKTIADGTPADVESIETIDLEARGPNFVFGRRNWIDIRQ
jgi:hypothetical protein